MKSRSIAARLFLAILIGASSAGASGVVIGLPKYNVSVSEVSVSGLSTAAGYYAYGQCS